MENACPCYCMLCPKLPILIPIKRIEGMIFMESIWRKQTKHIAPKASDKPSFTTHYDIIVIGAGLAGLLTAYYLQTQGKSVLVLEADEIASGQTERTTAKITSQHGLKYNKLIQTIGFKKAKLYAQANQAAIQEYENLIQDQHIHCQFIRVPAYLYTTREETPLRKEAEAASSLGINAFFTTETELPFQVTGAVCFPEQAQFSPLEFIRHIASELEILEHTQVMGVKGNQVITNDKVFTGDKIVAATHYPFRDVPGFYFLRQHQERSYVLALAACSKINGMYYGIDKDALSLRQAGDVLLLGGGSHRTGENESGGAYDFLSKAAKKYFPDCREEARWSAQDCMPHDGIPFIGRYAIFTPHLYVITGFQKWGMTTAMIAAMILRDELQGIPNPYSKLFTPQRCNLRAGIGNLLTDVGMSVKGLVKGWFHRPGTGADALAPGHGGIVAIDGKRYACYKEETGKLHKISARCPHMGCELTWNPDEKSWDCPCHGSRFDADGKLLDNPAKKESSTKSEDTPL